MFPFQSYNGFVENCSSDGYYGNLEALCSNDMMLMVDNTRGQISPTFNSISTSATQGNSCKSHKEAEKCRRERINGHLATLRTLLPNTTKKDKASLLAEVVERVTELKKIKTAMIGCIKGDDQELESPFPSENDEISLSYCDDNNEERTSYSLTLIQASLCCEDRPDLLSDMTQAIKSVGANVIKAEMMILGGRTKLVLTLQYRSGAFEGEDDKLADLRRGLRAVVDKPRASAALGWAVPGKKRAQLYNQGSSNNHIYYEANN